MSLDSSDSSVASIVGLGLMSLSVVDQSTPISSIFRIECSVYPDEDSDEDSDEEEGTLSAQAGFMLYLYAHKIAFRLR